MPAWPAGKAAEKDRGESGLRELGPALRGLPGRPAAAAPRPPAPAAEHLGDFGSSTGWRITTLSGRPRPAKGRCRRRGARGGAVGSRVDPAASRDAEAARSGRPPRQSGPPGSPYSLILCLPTCGSEADWQSESSFQALWRVAVELGGC